jgi:hypothetical protein
MCCWLPAYPNDIGGAKSHFPDFFNIYFQRLEWLFLVVVATIKNLNKKTLQNWPAGVANDLF